MIYISFLKLSIIIVHKMNRLYFQDLQTREAENWFRNVILFIILVQEFHLLIILNILNVCDKCHTPVIHVSCFFVKCERKHCESMRHLSCFLSVLEEVNMSHGNNTCVYIVLRLFIQFFIYHGYEYTLTSIVYTSFIICKKSFPSSLF